MEYKSTNRPTYLIEESRLRSNLSLIKSVADASGVEIILAFKAYALWKTFPIFREYINATTASSLYEARLAFEEFGTPAHTYSPAYTDYEIDDIARISSHLTFNSLSQFERHHERVLNSNPNLSIGLRILAPASAYVPLHCRRSCLPASAVSTATATAKVVLTYSNVP